MILLRREIETKEEYSVPDWVWMTLGYTLFLWSSLRMIGVGETNPDMLVAAAVYLASALLVRIRRGAAGSPTYLCLGLTLGLGYLTKSVMFPVSIAFLVTAFFVSLPQPKHFQRILVTTITFIAIAAPFIVASSLAEGPLNIWGVGKIQLRSSRKSSTPASLAGPGTRKRNPSTSYPSACKFTRHL